MPKDAHQQELVTKITDLLKRKYKGTSIKEQKLLFDDYDFNKDGRLKASELEQLLADADVGNWLIRGRWVKGVLDALDSNHDGQISWDEYWAVVSSS